MPKLKIKNSVQKRFKVTKNGKVLHGRQYRGHLRVKKSKKRLRRLKEPGQLQGLFAQKIKKMLGASSL